MYNLVNKVALVTGGANGIGAAIVREFVKENVKFAAILDIDESTGIELQNEIVSKYGNDKARFFKCDVTNDDQLHNIYEKLAEEFGEIDVVVNNAAIFDESPVTYKLAIATNLTALVSSTFKALQLMRVDQGGKGGTIINVSSATALLQRSPIPFVYAATKSAVFQLSNCMGMEGYYNHTKVRFITVCFGATDTNMFKTFKVSDSLVQEAMLSLQNYNRNNTLQSAEVAAQGVVESYKKGKSGSTWLVNSSKTYDVTDNVNQAYKIMSQHVDL